MSRQKLTEAISVENAVHIGTAHGYDLFDILTYEAAQQFTIEDRNHPAGYAYTHDATTFNTYINDTQHLYFFAKENTNKVYGGVVMSPTTSSRIKFVASDHGTVNVKCNFEFENAGENSNTTYYNRPLPFFLLPGAKFEGQMDCNSDDRFSRCAYMVDGTLKALLVQFDPAPIDELITLDNLPGNIAEIAQSAFCYGVEVSKIVLDENIRYISAHTLNNVHNQICVKMAQAAPSWEEGWNAGKESITTFNYGIDPETVAERERQLAAEREAERLRREEEERRRAEQERIQAQRQVQDLRYRVKGKEVIITGVAPNVSELTIPEEIEGKPVTTIAAYAFFDEEQLRKVHLPRTLKLIEQGAFFNSGVDSLRLPHGCILSKYNDDTVSIIHRL